MSRIAAIRRAEAYFDDGGFITDLARRVAIPSTSQEPERAGALVDYLCGELQPVLEGLGYGCRLLDNPVEGIGPMLFAERIEDPEAVTVLTYGHGDTVRGQDELWRDGLSPWTLVQEGDHLFGRGTADNKGQHSVNIGALAAVLAERGRLGFNSKILIETGEEMGSPGLREIALAEKDGLLDADILIASDGPRLAPGRPTLFLGSRGVHPIDLIVDLREGAHHSGNWGGLLANPAVILANALAAIADPRGVIQVPEWRPRIPDSVKAALAGITLESPANGPRVDPDWGEPDLSPAERVYGWNSFEVLAFTAGDPDAPVNAIPPVARAHCHLRYVVGTEMSDIIPALRRHLDRLGFARVEIRPGKAGAMRASRLDPADPWVAWASRSIARTMGAPPAVLPNIGGSLPNDIFADVLNLKTIWVPHSYAACSQHAPDEHMLTSIAREGLAIMAGLFWDLGESDSP